MNDSEAIICALIAAFVFSNTIETCSVVLSQTVLISSILEKSTLFRKIHSLSDLLHRIFFYINLVFKKAKTSVENIIYLFSGGENIRIKRSKIIHFADYSYFSSKRQSFYHIRFHIFTTYDGIHVEIMFSKGFFHDSNALDKAPFYPIGGSEIYPNSDHTDYSIKYNIPVPYEKGKLS